MRDRFSKMLIYSLIFSFLASNIPSLLGIEDPFKKACIELIVDLLLLLVVGNSLIRAGVFDDGKQTPHWKHLAILSPTFIMILIIPIMNLVSGIPILGYSLANADGLTIVIFVDIIIRAIYDELLFRYILQQTWFSQKTRIVRVLGSAAIYSAFKCFSNIGILFNSLIGIMFIFIGYFIIGCVLAFFMEYTHSIYVCIIYGVLYAIFMPLKGESYLLTALLLGAAYGFDAFLLILLNGVWLVVAAELFTILYLIFIYYFYFRKKEY